MSHANNYRHPPPPPPKFPYTKQLHLQPPVRQAPEDTTCFFSDSIQYRLLLGLEVNALKTVKMFEDLEEQPRPSASTMTQDLEWEPNIVSITKKAQDVLPEATEEVQPIRR